MPKEAKSKNVKRKTVRRISRKVEAGKIKAGVGVKRLTQAAAKDGRITAQEARQIRRLARRSIKNPAKAMRVAQQNLARAAKTYRRLRIEDEAQKALKVRHDRDTGTLTARGRADRPISRTWGVGDWKGRRAQEYEGKIKAPGKGWAISGYRTGSLGEKVPIYTYVGEGYKDASKGRMRKRGDGINKRKQQERARRNSFERGTNDALRDYTQSLNAEAEQVLSDASAYDDILASMTDLLESLNDPFGMYEASAPEAALPGTGYEVGTQVAGGPMNTYTTDYAGRRVPATQSLAIPIA